jgi:hypothetical protein
VNQEKSRKLSLDFEQRISQLTHKSLLCNRKNRLLFDGSKEQLSKTNGKHKNTGNRISVEYGTRPKPYFKYNPHDPKLIQNDSTRSFHYFQFDQCCKRSIPKKGAKTSPILEIIRILKQITRTAHNFTLHLT